MSKVMIGVDTGGTFTDVVLVDSESNHYETFKLPSTKDDPSKAAVEGVREVLNISRLSPQQVSAFRHGTTVATNSILEGRYAKTALITTRGFKDILELARQRRPHLYNLDVDKPDPIVPRTLRFEIKERIYANGEVLQQLKSKDILPIVDAILDEGVESVAICLLHSYVNDHHESLIKKKIHDGKHKLYFCTSSEVVNEFREYERFSSTVVNASLLPIMDEYLDHLEQETKQIGIKVSPKVMQSSGGIMSTNTARKRPISTFLSGPAAGVMGAVSTTKYLGIDNFITFDMGGTSADVCLVSNSRPSIRRQQTIGGLPVKTPTLDIHTIGAGGGSVAWVDRGGLLKVGPQSAGAVPGPACYQRGGQDPTVTDANLLLGRINPNSLLDGRMDLNPSLSEEVTQQKISKFINMDTVEAADGILKIVTHNIVQAIRLVSVEQGYDPRDFKLVAFGGAGPLHAAEVAKELGISTIIVPDAPGLMCALGLLHSDLRADFSRTRIMEINDGILDDFEKLKEEIIYQFQDWYQEEGFQNEQFYQNLMVDMRYKGQDFELTVSLPHDRQNGKDQLVYLKNEFHKLHEHQFGYASPEQPVEMVAIRMEVFSSSANIPEKRHTPLPDNPRTINRKVWFEQCGFVDTPVYLKQHLPVGKEIIGPAIVEQMDSTTVIPPNMKGTVHKSGTLILKWD